MIGNFIGTYLVAFATLNSRINNISEKARILSDIKLNDSVISILILSIFCGILMYIAVNSYKTSKDVFGRYIPIFMCVIVLPLTVSFAYAQLSGFAVFLRVGVVYASASGLCLFSVGFAYSDLNKSFIPPMLPSRFVASYGR